MLRQPAGTRFWLGCPTFAEQEFFGKIGGFALHIAEESQRRDCPRGWAPSSVSVFPMRPTVNSGTFPGDRQGYHGVMQGCQWERMSAGPPPSEPTRKPTPGGAFVVELGQSGVIEVPSAGTPGSESRVHSRTMGTETLPGVPSSAGELAPAGGRERDGASGWEVQAAREGGNRLFRWEYPLGVGYTGRISSGPAGISTDWQHLALCNQPGRRQIYLDGKPLMADETAQAQEVRDHWTASPRSLFVSTFGEGVQIRALRLSQGRRYAQEFPPPVEFARDSSTVVLLDFSQCSSSSMIADLCGQGRKAVLSQAFWVEVEKTWGP